MRLDELVKRRKPITKKFPNFHNIDIIASGAEGTVFKPKKSPNTIIKKVFLREENGKIISSYLDFIDTIMDHQDNPYFPKIYKAVVHKSVGDPYLILSMEKLHNMNHPILKDTARQLLSNLFKGGEIDFDSYGRISFINLEDLAHSLGFDSVESMISASRDPKFKEAYRILKPLLKKYDDDLHEGNIMVRLTGHGPQLVIIDPLTPLFVNI